MNGEKETRFETRFGEHEIAKHIALANLNLQPYADTTIEKIKACASIAELDRVGLTVYTVAESCHVAQCNYWDTLAAVKAVLLSRCDLTEVDGND